MSQPKKPRNEDVRTREYLTHSEVDRLATSASKLGRHGFRDALMVRLAYRHGLRVSELVGLRWDQVDLSAGTILVKRAKRGTPSSQPLAGWEIRALRKIARDYPDSPWLFVSERKSPMTADNVRRLVQRAGENAGLGAYVHPHQLRHACGFRLANDGVDTRSLQAYLGHRQIQHTVRYSELTPDRFKDFWGD